MAYMGRTPSLGGTQLGRRVLVSCVVNYIHDFLFSQFKLLHTSFSGQSSLSPARSPHPSSGGNSPILSRAGGGNLKSVVKELSEAVMQFGQYLTNYHSYLEQRLFQFSAVDKEEKLSPVNQQVIADIPYKGCLRSAVLCMCFCSSWLS